MKNPMRQVILMAVLITAVGVVVAGAQQNIGAVGRMNSLFTPEKIEKDLEGRSVGPDSSVKVKTGTGSDSSYSVYATIPQGIVFDSTNILGVTILEVKKQNGKAQVVVHVETVSMHAGRLRLHYEYIAGTWTLMSLENLDFRQTE